MLDVETFADDLAREAPRWPGAADTPQGYRHLFGPPASHQSYKIHGQSPLVAHASEKAARALMRKLSLRMEDGLSWPTHDVSDAKPWENPHIPSGYAYLFQLVGHDLVHTSVPFSANSERKAVLNARRSALSLETIYGEGPIACPLAYAPENGRSDFRIKLRLGRIQRDGRTIDAGCPYRDIARSPRDLSSSEPRGLALTDPLLADPRNDDHAILSQLTALFALLHNGLVERLTHGSPRNPAEANARYLAARSIATHLFRKILRNDLLRRFLDPKIYQLYSRGFSLNGKASTPRPWAVPIEFSHGAIRFGHSLVRHEYRINDGALNDLIENLTKTSLSDAVNMPLNESWIVQWSHFFAIDGSKPNLTKRIGPHYSGGLASNRIFPAIDDTNRVGLAYRDLVSSSLAGLWSLSAFVEEIRRRRPSLIDSAPLLADHEARKSQIAEWLGMSRLGGLDAADIDALSDEPPLSFFVLWEAAFEPRVSGLRLGRLGSIIIAETIFGALGEVHGSSGWSHLAPRMPSIECGAILERADEIESMSDLVLFVAELCELSQASPAFV